ncbi:MAG TPA: alanine racemase [Gemmatimonadales bacterium]|nr:alanine racemase [Gemmatimonadales bacterium]
MSARKSRAWVEVNLAALVENARAVARFAGTRLLPIVKANAYGVGAAAVAQALEQVDPWGYGVATIEEGAELRAAGIARPVLVCTPGRRDQFDRYRQFDLTPALGDRDSLAAWLAGPERPCHLEIDTGMRRGGLRWDEIDGIRDLPGLERIEGCYTQFHSSERSDGSADEQLERFLSALERLPRRPPLVHVANSGAALRDRKYAFDAVRPGVYLYGGTPGGALAPGRPVVSLRAVVVSVRRVCAGESVSYNAHWAAPRDTVVATLGIGYADGVRQSIAPTGQVPVLLNGARCPIVGLVTMDLTMIETGATPVAVGDVATLIGETRGGVTTLQQFAEWSGVQQRDLLCGLGARLPRIYE